MYKKAKEKITLVQGDITREYTDVIVNAANSTLLGGGGVDGAIHRAAGPDLLTECSKLGGCPVGEARTTDGYKLNARYVVHTVGPIWRGGSHNEEALLRNAYTNSLKEAVKVHAHSIAFPAISTGVYGFPKDRAAEIAVSAILNFLSTDSTIEEVHLVCFSPESVAAHSKALRRY